MDSSGDGGDEGAVLGPGSPGPASAPAAVGGGSASGSVGKPPVKRVMKTPYQLEVLERTYSEDPYPNEVKRAELSVQLGLTDRQLQMWFCHRRLKDRKPQQTKRQLRDDDVSMPVVVPPPPVLPHPPLPSSDIMVGTVGPYGEHLLPRPRRGLGRSSAVPRISVPEIGRRYYEAPQIVLPPLAPMQLTEAEQRVIDSVEALIGEPLRDDGPVLGIEFDPLPPGAFGAPIVPEQHRQPFRHHESKMFPGHDHKLMKASAFLPSVDPFVPSTVTGKRKSLAGSSSHHGSQAVHEYQFLPQQPSDIYERASQSRFYDVPAEASNSRISSLHTGSHFLHGADQAATYTFHGQTGSSHLAQHCRSPGLLSASTDHEIDMSNVKVTSAPSHGQFDIPQIAGLENSLAPSEMGYHDEDANRVDRKRKHNEEAKITKEVEAHEKRIRKELEKQDLLNRKREEQMRREMERHDRERRKEEDRLLRERQRENERLQREQRRENKRMEKFLQKQSVRAEKLRQKEELRKEKEAARQKAANERATARRIAREYMELMEDERLELMELAARSKGLPSMLSLDSDTLQQLDSFRGMLRQFPTESVRLKVPFPVKPWTASEDNIGNILMVWKFFITFADVLRLPSFTLDEFIQALHDYDSRLLGELHVGLLESIIKDIEDVARTPSVALGVNQSSANPGGGHPQIVEGAYAWGFNILTWQQHLNFLTWPEILRQFGLCAGFGPPLKKRSAEFVQYRGDNEGRDGENVISTIRSGSAAVSAAAKMKERGYTNRCRSRHRLTPGTVKFAAFHVLSLEGSKGLTILEVAEKIQKSGLRDLTTSKTPEASISAALSRDIKLFERTAPSTYCVKEPYRKDPADSEAVLSAAREKIRAFQNALSECEEAEKDVDDAERDEDSDGDEADIDPDGDEVNIEEKDSKSLSIGAQDGSAIAIDSGIEKESNMLANTLTPATIDVKSNESGSFHTLERATSNSVEPSIGDDAQDTEIDESNQGESWVQGLAEGDYCDLSVEERLNALVALIGVATEGNSIRAILEERLEAASALKKQMWAEAQLDKRRLREEFTSKVQYDYSGVIKADAEQENNTTECSLTPLHNLAKDNGGNASTVNNDLLADKQNQLITCNIAHERNGVSRDLSANPENLSIQQYASSEKTRSQLKSYIGHKAEQLYVYRSLPLGQDRRRNRYWQFCASASPNDPGSGRIFFESRDGYWRVIDSTEAFDALVASLDTRGIRESHLYSMLQSIEPSFKEAIGRKKSSSVEHPPERVLKNGSNEMISSNGSNEFGSPCSTLSGVASDNTVAYSDSFKIELGRNDAEKIGLSKRAHVFIKWMWKECYNRQYTCAMKYGKKRLTEFIQSCDYCYQIHLAEERHCSSCHRTFKPIHNFSEHLSHCEEKQRTNPNWKMQTADNSILLGLRLLKLLLATIEASLPTESLQSFWTDGYRKTWGVKLYSASCTEEVFQMLTMLEGAIKRDYLSADFEVTTEWLNLSSQDIAHQSSGPHSASATVLPWVPNTTAAVALRLLDLDSAIAYTNNPKAGSNKEQESRDFTKLPRRYTTAKNKQAIEQFGTAGFDRQDGGMITHNNVRRGRGRGSRGGSRGGRSCSRGGRVPRGISSSSRIQFTGDNSVSYEEMPRKYARCGRGSSGRGRGRGRGRGLGRGRGHGRGLRTVRPRQAPPEPGSRSIPKANLLGSFSMLSKSNPSTAVHSPESSGAEEWTLEKREYVKNDDNTSVSQSDGSEENEENGDPMNEEYDEQFPDYSRDNYGTHSLKMMDDGSEDKDEDAEGDEAGEDGEDYEAEDPIGEDDNDIEMGEDDEIRDDDDDDGEGDVNNADEDEGGTSYSSEYSD